MRLRTTATVLLAGLALVLPTAGQSMANDRHDRDSLGELHYRYADEEGDVHRRSIEPADNDTCYQLPGTRNHPAFKVENDTDSLALVFRDRNCGGEPQEVLEPGDEARNLNVRSVYFKPTDDNGHHGGRHDNDNDNDDSDHHDEDDLFRSVFRNIG
ncbi:MULTISPECIES: hypothetical protein [unclassified Streptomyces]|uniref:hypothetical protein n=1 Tax=unclassified Streptomyces TaxID=2593676 RepID=UPI00364CC626